MAKKFGKYTDKFEILEDFGEYVFEGAKKVFQDAMKRLMEKHLAEDPNLTDVFYIHPHTIRVVRTRLRKIRSELIRALKFDYFVETFGDVIKRWHPAIWYTKGHGVPVDIDLVLNVSTLSTATNTVFADTYEPASLAVTVLVQYFLPRISCVPDAIRIWVQPDQDIMLFAYALKQNKWVGITANIEYDEIGGYRGAVVPVSSIKHYSGHVQQYGSGRLFVAKEEVFVETDHVSTTALLDGEDLMEVRG